MDCRYMDCRCFTSSKWNVTQHIALSLPDVANGLNFQLHKSDWCMGIGWLQSHIQGDYWPHIQNQYNLPIYWLIIMAQHYTVHCESDGEQMVTDDQELNLQKLLLQYFSNYFHFLVMISACLSHRMHVRKQSYELYIESLLSNE